MKRLTPLLVLLVSGLMLVGCGTLFGQTPPGDVPDDFRPDMQSPMKTASGKSSAETSTNDMPMAPAVAWGASTADSTSTTAKYQPTNTTSGTGSLVTGFQLGAMANVNQKARDFVAQFMKDDPVMRSIGEELAFLMDGVEYSEDWQTRADALRAALSERSAVLMASLSDAGLSSDLNLASLRNIVVVGFITSNVGHDERAPSDAEVEAVSKVLPDIVLAAGKLETIQGGDGE